MLTELDNDHQREEEKKHFCTESLSRRDLKMYGKVRRGAEHKSENIPERKQKRLIHRVRIHERVKSLSLRNFLHFGSWMLMA